MPAEMRFFVDLASLVIGFAFVLWGLRIFKAYVAVVGLLAGAGAGAAIGSVAIDADTGLLIGSLVGGLIGALVAWPLQRVIAFLMAGAATGLLAALLAGAPGSDAFLPALLIGFVAGGVLGLFLFERVVVAAMAFAGAQAIFHAAFVPSDVYLQPTYDAVGRALLAAYGTRVAAFAVLTASCLLLALWHQGPRARKRKVDPRMRAVRRVPAGAAFLILAANAAVAFAAFALGETTSVFELTGLHPLSWAFVSMATMLFLHLRARATAPEPAGGSRLRAVRRVAGYPALALFGVAAVPIGTALVFRAAGSGTWGLEAYYRAFIEAGTPLVAFKWFIALAWVPLLLLRATPRIDAATSTSDATAPDGATDGVPQSASPVPAREPALNVDPATAT